VLDARTDGRTDDPKVDNRHNASADNCRWRNKKKHIFYCWYCSENETTVRIP